MLMFNVEEINEVKQFKRNEIKFEKLRSNSHLRCVVLKRLWLFSQRW